MATLSGYAIRWNSEALIAGQFIERFERGAFTESLRQNEALFLYHHNSGDIMGRTTNGTMMVEEDDIGLRYEVSLSNTNLGKDASSLVERRDVTGVSIGFALTRSSDEKWTKENGNFVRTINRAMLREISLTPIPAYDSTSVEITRAEIAQPNGHAERKARMRRKLVNHMRRQLMQRDLASRT